MRNNLALKSTLTKSLYFIYRVKIDGFSQTNCTDIDCEAVIDTGTDVIEGPPPIMASLNKRLGGQEGNDTVRTSSMHTCMSYYSSFLHNNYYSPVVVIGRMHSN